MSKIQAKRQNGHYLNLNNTKDERVDSNSSSPLIGDKMGKTGEPLPVA